MTQTKVTSDFVDPAPSFTEAFTSSDQTITSAGSLTLAHGLSSTPTLFQCRLKCTTTEHNYSVNDEVIVPTGPYNLNSNLNSGVSIVPDSTNINIRYGSESGVFDVLNKTTGARATITNGNWSFIIKAWA